MKTSLVMTTYNGEKYLVKQLDSIRNQTKKLDEVYILDDCSLDNTQQILTKYVNDNKLNWQLFFNKSNVGFVDNFKNGLKLVTGDIVFLADQDDIWHKDKVETMCKYMNDRILSLASSFNFIDQNDTQFTIKSLKNKSNNNLLAKPVEGLLTVVTLEDLLHQNFAQGCCMAIKKEIVDIYLQVSNGLLPHDWELNIIAASKQGCCFLNESLIDYRIHNDNTIGLDEVINTNVVTQKGKRINERLKQELDQIKNADFALSLDLSNTDKQLVTEFKTYQIKRTNNMKNHKAWPIFISKFKGLYHKFGTTKTWIGDLISIYKK